MQVNSKALFSLALSEFTYFFNNCKKTVNKLTILPWKPSKSFQKSCSPWSSARWCYLRVRMISPFLRICSPALICVDLRESAASDSLKWWMLLLPSFSGNGENPQPPQSLRVSPHPSAVRLWQRAHGHEERVLCGWLQKSCGFSQGEVSLLALWKITISFFLPEVCGSRALRAALQLWCAAKGESPESLRASSFLGALDVVSALPSMCAQSTLLIWVSFPTLLQQFRLWLFSYLTS